MPKQRDGSVKEYIPPSIFHPCSPSGQNKSLPIPWKSQISVITTDKESIGKRSRHSRQSSDSSPRHFANQNLCLPLALYSGGKGTAKSASKEMKELEAEEEANEETLVIWFM